ncbi:hypothetical protein J4G48_0028865 [Bradyrhizobium barranii subsp. apii]|uniref:hypothetical protein n=1 Tax=Bradyrhizobium barranii TaxID=2992140 RepID=UPI001AA111B2|nr:hypothetical protein [Bradyrhizobium barranii]UPT93374.1 hypothetical protein J4G48_0028865 [Bradyrhizobium barranii subsp. apii]
MATLSSLVEAVAGVTGLPTATVFAYGRFARQAGAIGQSGRGRSAAEMNITDAANLLIAIGGTGVTREAGSTVETFRNLRNGRFYDFQGAEFLTAGISFLASHGVRPDTSSGTRAVRIQGAFGTFFEFLINSTLTGQLANLFRHIPVAEIPSDLWAQWISEKNSRHRHKRIEDLIKEGLIKPHEPESLKFGEHINVEIRFNRLVPSVEIEFLRDWDGPQVMGVVTFGPDRGGKAKGAHRLQITAGFTQHTLAAAALVVDNKVSPSAVAALKPVEALFARQFSATGSTSSMETET